MNVTSPAPEEREAARGGLRRVSQQCGKELVIMCGVTLVYLLLVLLANAKLANDDCNVPCSMRAWMSGPFGALAFAIASLNWVVATLFWLFASRTTRRERLVAGTVGCVGLAAAFGAHGFTLPHSLVGPLFLVLANYLLIFLPLASWLVIVPRHLLARSYGAGTYLFRSGLFFIVLFGLRSLSWAD